VGWVGEIGLTRGSNYIKGPVKQAMQTMGLKFKANRAGSSHIMRALLLRKSTVGDCEETEKRVKWVPTSIQTAAGDSIQLEKAKIKLAERQAIQRMKWMGGQL